MKKAALILSVLMWLTGFLYAACEVEAALYSDASEATDSLTEEDRQPLSIQEELSLYADNRDIIYRFLTEDLHLNHAVACGIVANIHYESRFNPEALGDSGTSYGICQWHNKRYTLLVNWSEEAGMDYALLETQLLFMKYELEHNFSFVMKRLANIANTSRGAYTAGNYWCVYYERPKNKYINGDKRGELARQTYWYLLGKEL